MMRIGWAILTVSIGLCVGCDAPVTASAICEPHQSLPQEPLRIVSGDSGHDFMVELADEAPERQIGLMCRDELGEDAGMLFDFKRQKEISMWMQNTYVSLDMLFIKADGRIAHIAKNTKTESTRSIPSRVPVLAVLEVNAGTVDRLGILPGDRVEHPLFENVE